MNEAAQNAIATVIEEAADKMGEMLVQTAEGLREHSYEEIAKSALVAGLSAVIIRGPNEVRVSEVAGSIYRKLHKPESANWSDLSEIEKSFWHDIACAATQTADEELLRQIEACPTDGASPN